MSVLKLITAWRQQDITRHNQNAEYFSMAKLIVAVEEAEKKRLALEAKYMPSVTVRIGKVDMRRAAQHLNANGYALRIVKEGNIWVVVELNAIEQGLLAEIHVGTIPYNPDEPKPQHAFELVDAVDYERIG